MNKREEVTKLCRGMLARAAKLVDSKEQSTFVAYHRAWLYMCAIWEGYMAIGDLESCTIARYYGNAAYNRAWNK